MPVTRKPRTTLAPISVRDAQDAQREDRVLDPRISSDEERGAAGSRRRRRSRACARRPAVLGRGDDRVDREHHRRRHEHRAGDVDAACAGRCPGRFSISRAPSASTATPIGRLTKKIQCQSTDCDQRAAEQQAERAAGGDDEHVGAHRLHALVGAREVGDDQGDDHRGGDRAAEALQEARGDQRELVVGEAAERRGDGEEGDAGEEDALAAEQVAEPAGHQQEAPVGDEVGADDPREVGLREAQVALDDGERDVDDRHVDDHHQLTEADDDQRHPLAPRGALWGRDSH